MKTKKLGLHPAARLETGAAILAAAQVVDIKSVKQRVAAFAAAHRDYTQAQRTVEAAEARLAAAQAGVAGLDAKQDAAVEAVACSLVFDGNGRRNPFAAYSAATPSTIKELALAEEAKAIHKLVAAVQADKTVSPATLRAARAAEQTAQAVETALLPMEKLEATLRTAREARDHIGHTWQTTLTALKHSARATDNDGGPALSMALFGALRRRTKKAAAAPAAPAPAVSTPPAPPAPTA